MPASPAGPMRREGSDKAVPAGDGDFPEPVKDEIPSPKTVYKPSSRRNLHDDLLDMLVFYPGGDQVFHGEQKLKKVILVFSAGVVLICAIPMVMGFLSS